MGMKTIWYYVCVRQRLKKNVKKKVQFVEDVKQLPEAGVMCSINGDTFFSFTKNSWIGDSGALFHIMNDDTSLFNVIDINELIQGSSRNKPATKKGKLCVNIQQVDETECVHTQWSVKFCPKAGASLFSLRC